MLCKVMLNLVRSTSVHAPLPEPSPSPLLSFFPRQKSEDVNSLLTTKLALKYANMRAAAHAHQGRNLADFEKALRDYRDGKAFPLSFSASSFLSPSAPLVRYLITCFLLQNFPPTQQSTRI